MPESRNDGPTTVGRAAEQAELTASSDRHLLVLLHDLVRDRVQFGFTPFFDSAEPATTFDLGVGHSIPQARLFVELLRREGFEARYAPVTITHELLHGVVRSKLRLSHVFTEVRVDGAWQRLDSYVVDPPLRRAAVERLRARKRRVGYGCHVDASDWDATGDAFSQIAEDRLIAAEHDPVDDLEDFFRSPDYQHRTGPVRYSSLLTPLRLVSDRVIADWNSGVEAVRRADPGSEIVAA